MMARDQERDVDRACERLQDADRHVRIGLIESRIRYQRSFGLEPDVFDAQLALIEDPGFLQAVRQCMATSQCSVEVAIAEVIDACCQAAADGTGPSERVGDLRQVGSRLLAVLPDSVHA